MPSNLLHKLSSNPVWEETIKLYSGLLEGAERKSFILDLSHHDILLAAECKTISVKNEIKLKTELIGEAKQKALSTNADMSAVGILSLLELKSTDTIYNLLINIATPKKEHKEALDMVMREIAPEKMIDIFNILLQLYKMNQRIYLHWGLDSFKTTVTENGDKYSDGLIREVLLFILNTKRDDLIVKVADLIGSYSSDLILSSKTMKFVKDFISRETLKRHLKKDKLKDHMSQLQNLLDIVKKTKIDPKHFKEIFKKCYFATSKKQIRSHNLPDDIKELFEEFKFSRLDLYDWKDKGKRK